MILYIEIEEPLSKLIVRHRILSGTNENGLYGVSLSKCGEFLEQKLFVKTSQNVESRSNR